MGPSEDNDRIYPVGEIASTKRVRSGALQGIVIDAKTGIALPGAQVYFSRTGVGALTGDSGMFFFDSIPDSATAMGVELIGYARELVDIGWLSDANGYAARLALRPVPIVVCELRSELPYAIVVRVRDTVTGLAPIPPVRLVVTDGEFADSTEDYLSHPKLREFMVLRAAYNRPGTYDISVSGANYLRWSTEGIEASYNEDCSSVMTRRLRVWLLPSD